jgi:hypothetical protein
LGALGPRWLRAAAGYRLPRKPGRGGVDVDHDVQVEVKAAPFGFQLGYVPGPYLVRAVGGELGADAGRVERKMADCGCGLRRCRSLAPLGLLPRQAIHGRDCQSGRRDRFVAMRQAGR